MWIALLINQNKGFKLCYSPSLPSYWLQFSHQKKESTFTAQLVLSHLTMNDSVLSTSLNHHPTRCYALHSKLPLHHTTLWLVLIILEGMGISLFLCWLKLLPVKHWMGKGHSRLAMVGWDPTISSRAKFLLLEFRRKKQGSV